MTVAALTWLVSTRIAVDIAVLVLVKGTVWITLVATVGFVLRGRSAALQHRVWAAGLAGLLLLAGISVVAAGWGDGVVSYPSETSLVGLEAIETALPGSGARALARESAASGSQAPAPTLALPPATLFLLAWWAGFTLFTVRTVADLLRVARLRRTSQPVGPGHPATRTVERVCADLEIHRPVAVVLTPRAGVAATVGSLRPIVALGPDVAAMPEDALEAVIVHELAHIRRGDSLTALLALAATPLYWVNPLFWMLRCRIVATLERACDDEVLARGVRPSLYARVLLDFAEAGLRSAPAPAPGILSLSPTRRRIEAVLDGRLDRRAAPTASVLVAAAVVVATAIPGASLRLVGHEPGTGPTPALVAALGHPDARVRQRAATTLGRRSSAGAREPLEALLDDADPSVRVAAGGALAALADPASLPALSRVLDRSFDGGRGEHGFVLKLAITTASRMDRPEAADLLEAQLDRPVPQLRWLALERLAAMPAHRSRALAHVERFARHDPDARNRAAARALLDELLRSETAP